MDSRHDTRGLSPDFYIDPDLFAQQRCKVLGRSWHYLASSSSLGEQAGSVSPQVLLPGSLDEPVVLLRHEGGGESCLSNVCSHRAAEVVLEPGIVSQLRCPYHGRCFGLDGRLRSAPGFADPSGDLEPVPSPPLSPRLLLGLLRSHALPAFRFFFGFFCSLPSPPWPQSPQPFSAPLSPLPPTPPTLVSPSSARPAYAGFVSTLASPTVVCHALAWLGLGSGLARPGKQPGSYQLAEASPHPTSHK